jgi:RNA polymerase sigma factor (sigma-70 family)
MGTTTQSATVELVARARDDDDDAWAELVGRYGPLLHWCARRTGLSPQDAADAVQLTWLRCWEHLGQLNGAEHLGSWLVTICRREAIRVASKRLRDLPVDDVDDMALRAAVAGGSQVTPAGQVEDRLELAWHTEVLRAAVATLPARERRLVEVLLEPDPPSYRQIGRRLGMPVGSIGPVRQRALRRLEGMLRARGVTAPLVQVSR